MSSNVRKCGSNPSSAPRVNSLGKGGSKKFLHTLLVIVLVLVITYILVFTIKYLITSCYTKKTYLEYLFGFNFEDVCVFQYPPASQQERQVENEKEVFHVGHQVLTYDQAKCKCEAYGGRLATKNEVIKAYNKGANWCTYGWTEGQNAYYPVQKCYWDDLQNDPTKKDSCGHPGINGGHFANPLLKFGANCYGVKPGGSVETPKIPYCEEAQFCDRRENASASEESTLDDIVPFNNKLWSRYSA